MATAEHNPADSWTHDRLQQECLTWHKNTFKEDRMLVGGNINNSHNRIKGAQNKALGAKKGRSDSYYQKGGRMNWFEYKVGSDRQKSDQKEFQAAVEADGARYFLIRTKEEYINVVLWIREQHKLNSKK